MIAYNLKVLREDLEKSVLPQTNKLIVKQKVKLRNYL